jgi:hypothetical protein
VVAPDVIRVPPHLRERTPPVWLPPTAKPRPGDAAAAAGDDGDAGPDADGTDDDDELGLLVARLTRAEHAVVRRLLELLTADDFAAGAVNRHLRALDRLIAELRQHLTTSS